MVRTVVEVYPHIVTSAEETALLASKRIQVRSNVELLYVSAYNHDTDFAKMTVGIQDDDGDNIGLLDGFSNISSSLKWSGSIEMFLRSIELNHKNPIAGDKIDVGVIMKVLG